MAEPDGLAKEEEVASGLLTFVVAGTTYRVPELKWRANREWQARLQATFLELAMVPADTVEGMAAMADAERALVRAYDATGVLGDLEDATERDIDAIYNRLVTVAFPFSASPIALMVTLARAAASERASSMSGPSRSGTSAAPTTSRRASRSDKSSSSTPRRRSGSTGIAAPA